MTPGPETPVIGSKKITIHVGGSTGSASASPAPQAGQTIDSGRPGSAMGGNRNIPPSGTATTTASFQVDRARAVPGSAMSPSPSVMGAIPNTGPQQLPAGYPRPNGQVIPVPNAMNGVPAPGQNFQQFPPTPQGMNGHPAPVQQPRPLVYDSQFRAPGRGKFLNHISSPWKNAQC